MNKLKNASIILILTAINIHCYAQDKGLTWKELGEQYEFPKWYTEARFGIWAHWGAQTEPRLGCGWYARHMYMRDVGFKQSKNKFILTVPGERPNKYTTVFEVKGAL
ncbi:MAG: alpha-L-fucosidase [Bacteroidota bacterium]